jgi:hypothetical protein
MPVTPVAVVPTIETSTVMANSGFVNEVTISGKAFINNLTTNDALAVVSFNAQGSVAYPSTNALAVVDSTLSQLTAASAAVQALTYTNPSVNIGAGLQTAYGLLNSLPVAGSVPGVLLISSGQQTAGGTDPLTLATYRPTWACAPGPTANTALLNQIAALSGGQYYYMPTPLQMATVLNQIRGQFPNWQTVVNQSKSVGTLGSWLQPVVLASGLAEAQFSVVWENANLTQTNSPNPGPNQVSVTLVQPPGITLPDVPTRSGGGYCVFNKLTPVPGTNAMPWYVQVMYPGTVNPLPMTIGVFARPKTSQALRLALRPAAPATASAPLQVIVALEGATEPIEITAATAEIMAPRMTLGSALRMYADAMLEVPCESGEPLARLLTLRRLLLPRGDILGHEQRMIPLAMTDHGQHTFTAAAAAIEGSLNCKVHVQGRMRHSGAAFEHTELLSLHVPGRRS